MITTGWCNISDEYSYSNVSGGANDDGEPSSFAPTKKQKSAPSKPSYEQCGLPSRQRELDELDEPDPRSGCYGCCYMAEQEAGATPCEEIIELINIMRKSIGKTDLINLALYVADKYRKIQEEVNKSLMFDEKPLPDWTAATILHHMRFHNTDAELQKWHRVTDMQELADIALDASVIIDPETGKRKIDQAQAKLYLEIVKQIESLVKSDPSKQLYYSGGNFIDPKSTSEGFISYSGKPLISEWRNYKKNS